MACASLMGVRRGRVKAADVDTFNNRRRTLDGYSTISMNLNDLVRSLFDLEFPLNVEVADVDIVVGTVRMRNTGTIFTLVVCDCLTLAALGDVLPTGKVGGMDHHVAPKDDLSRRSGKRGMMGSTHAECDVL